MASPAVQTRDHDGSSALAARRYEHLFFSGMALLLLATVFVGFAPTYYLAGIVSAPEPGGGTLPSDIVRVHAIVSTIWMLLFAAQVSLVAAQRARLHRRLGLLGMLVACAMFVTGLMAGTDTLARNVPPGLSELLYIVNVSMVAVFAVLMVLAFRWRNTPPAQTADFDCQRCPRVCTSHSLSRDIFIPQHLRCNPCLLLVPASGHSLRPLELTKNPPRDALVERLPCLYLRGSVCGRRDGVLARFRGMDEIHWIVGCEGWQVALARTTLSALRSGSP
jgi:hypothetical protein